MKFSTATKILAKFFQKFSFWKHGKGSLGKILWTVTVTDLAAQTQYVIDGVEEAVGELIVGVKATTVFKEACNEGSRKDFYMIIAISDSSWIKIDLSTIEDTIENPVKVRQEARRWKP